MIRRFSALIILLSLTRICPAEEALQLDRITVSSGAVLTGQIQSVDDTTIILQTDYAGILNVDLGKVKKVELDPVRETGIPVALVQAGEAKKKEEVAAAKPTVAASSTKKSKEKEIGKWKVNGRFSLDGRGGNTEKLLSTLSMKGELEREFDRFNLYGRYTYLDDPGKKRKEWQPKVSNEIKIGGQYTNFFHKKTGIFFREELERDRYEGINFRSTTASGISYQFKNTKELRLESRTGFSYRYEYAITDEDQEYPGMDFGFNIFWKFANWGSFTGEYTYVPSVERISSYIISQDSYIDLPLKSANWLSMQIGISSQYSSDLVPGREHLDYKYYASLSASWK